VIHDVTGIGEKHMIDIFAAIYVFLFLFTSCMTLSYYLKIRQASKEYAKAKKALDEMLISFNKELQTEDEKIRELEQKNDAKIEEVMEAIAQIEPKISDLEEKVKKIKESTNVEGEKKEQTEVSIVTSPQQQTEQAKEVIVASVSADGHESSENVAAPPIPLKRESTLASLTDTEIKILELIANQGEKTAIQIRNEIKLTREHTARLMKKLYISGYVERRTDRTPYVYRLKKEMEPFLGTQKA
jgi:predicted ArsR family transcriptional regulator